MHCLPHCLLSRIPPLSLALALLACESDRPPAEGAVPESADIASTCRIITAASVLLPDLREASGIAISRKTPSRFWGNNDSGSEPVLVAFDSAGRTQARVRISGAEEHDWEDIALAPCAAGSCLFIADIGDNRARRPFVTVYRVPEPAATDSVSLVAEPLHAVYPDGSRNAEAIFIHEGRIYIVTKGSAGPVAIYRFPQPLQPGRVATLEKIAVLRSEPREQDLITGASASPNGEWVAVRSYAGLDLYHAADITAGRATPAHQFDIAALREPTGEGVALLDDGTVYLVSEAGGGRRPGRLSSLKCTLD